MRAAVRAVFVDWSTPLEGVVDFLYLDVKGLVTTAMGNLVDPMIYALPLPFVRPDGWLARRDEIIAAWNAVKARQDLALHGGMAFRNVTTLRLTKEGIAFVVGGKLDENDRYLRTRFGPDYDDWPADAQLAVHSMSWACGPAFRFPQLEAALRVRDFVTAAAECTIHPEQGTIVERNRRQRLLFMNAARVLEHGLDPDVLYYPRDLELAEAPTQPELPVLEDDGGAARREATLETTEEPREPPTEE